MTPNRHFDTKLKQIMALVLAVIEIFKMMKKYELICKRRDHHEPMSDDLAEFMNYDATKVKITTCIDCGCALQLEYDVEDSDIFWVREI